MPLQGDTLQRSREEILSAVLSSFQSKVSDIYTGEDGNLYLIISILSGIYEAVFTGLDVLGEDMFIITANPQALGKYGTQFAVPQHPGTTATGELTFSGAGGTFIDQGARVAYDPQTGADLLYFVTTMNGTIPNPGSAAAPIAVVSGTSGSLNGLYEYVVTYYTADGETLPGDESNAVSPVNKQVNLSSIQAGGVGTLGRRIYRRKNGVDPYKLVHQISDNTTTTWTDDVADASVGTTAPVTSTSAVLTLSAESETFGVKYNASPGAIRALVLVPDGVTDVVNNAPFVNGTDAEFTEPFRARLLESIRAPKTGAPADLVSWAREIEGVETAYIYENTNGSGAAEDGHVLVRISGPQGTIPNSETIAATLAHLEEKDYANITIHVATFTATPTNVTVAIVLTDGFSDVEVTPSVTEATAQYVNQLPVEAPFLVAGLIDAIYGLAGVDDVSITTPSTNQTTTTAHKRTAGTITVTT